MPVFDCSSPPAYRLLSAAARSAVNEARRGTVHSQHAFKARVVSLESPARVSYRLKVSNRTRNERLGRACAGRDIKRISTNMTTKIRPK